MAVGPAFEAGQKGGAQVSSLSIEQGSKRASRQPHVSFGYALTFFDQNV